MHWEIAVEVHMCLTSPFSTNIPATLCLAKIRIKVKLQETEWKVMQYIKKETTVELINMSTGKRRGFGFCVTVPSVKHND